MRSCIKNIQPVPHVPTVTKYLNDTAPTKNNIIGSMKNSQGKFYPNVMKFLVISPQPFKRKGGLTSFSITVGPRLFFKWQRIERKKKIYSLFQITFISIKYSK